MGKEDRQKYQNQAAKNPAQGGSQSGASAPPAQSAPAAPAAPAASAPQNAKSLSDIEIIQKQMAEYEDHLKRLAAEFDNYKKRAEKEKQAARSLGKAEALAPFLDMDEVFEKALAHSKSGSSDASNPAASNNSSAMHDGLMLLHKQLHSIFAHAGVKEISCHGAPNHAYHETIMQVAGGRAGEIAQVLRKGYTMGEFVLRPAQVSVFKGEEKEKKKAENSEQEKKTAEKQEEAEENGSN